MEARKVTRDMTVAELAVSIPRSTRVFSRHGIDFCCGGSVPLEEACVERGVAVETVMDEIRATRDEADPADAPWEHAPLEDLIEHILSTYHRKLTKELPHIEALARKVHEVHGAKDPERLGALLATFLDLKEELEPHMLKEERILFPMIVQGHGAMAQGPVQVMRGEHDRAGSVLRTLRALTDDYTVPEGACATWRALWEALAGLERDLHEHIHLENNVLFPRALGG